MIQTPSTLSNQKPINFEEKEKKDKSQSELIRNQSKDKQLKLQYINNILFVILGFLSWKINGREVSMKTRNLCKY